MTTPRARIREISPQWLVNIPELETRPNLLQAICYMHSVRKALFRFAGQVESIALIPDRHVARRCLNLWWKAELQTLYHNYHDRLRQETGSDLLYNELIGCMQNILTNMKRKAGCVFMEEVRKNEHDVVREYM